MFHKYFTKSFRFCWFFIFHELLFFKVTQRYNCIFIVTKFIIKSVDKIIFGVIGCKLYEKGGVDSVRISEFIRKHITDKYKNKLVILDNAGAHRDKKVKDEITKNNNYLYLVPYQHQLNPIEELFNQVKYYLRLKSPIEFTDIKKVIVYALNKITKENFKNYYKHAFIKSKGVMSNKPNSQKKSPKNYKD